MKAANKFFGPGLAVLGFLALLSLFIGVESLNPLDLFRADDLAWFLLLNSRLPRLFALLLSAWALCLAGILLQSLSANPYASPETATTQAWASLGFLLGLRFFPEALPLLRMLASFVFALGGTGLFLLLSRRLPYKSKAALPLLGMALSLAIDAFTDTWARSMDLLQSLHTWLSGDFTLITLGRYEILGITLPVLALAWWFADHFTLAGLGEEKARSLGLSWRSLTILGLALASLLSAAVLTSSGILPFIGLVVPNIVRLFLGDQVKKIIPYSCLLGSLILLISDLISRLVLYPFELPLSISLGVIGSLLFLFVQKRSLHG